MYFYIESDDKDLIEHECGHYSSLDDVYAAIARNKILGSEKFRYIDYDDEKEFEYYLKVEKRFLRLLKYYLDPDKKQ